MTAKPANAAAARLEAVANEGITPDTWLIAPSPLDSAVLPTVGELRQQLRWLSIGLTNRFLRLKKWAS